MPELDQDERKYKYCGPESRPHRVKTHETPLSTENALSVIRTAWAVGRVHLGTHFKERCAERGIDMLDVENLITQGAIRGCGEYVPEYKTCKYRVVGTVDDRSLEVVVALDSTEDYADSPLAILITAYERKAEAKP